MRAAWMTTMGPAMIRAGRTWFVTKMALSVLRPATSRTTMLVEARAWMPRSFWVAMVSSQTLPPRRGG